MTLPLEHVGRHRPAMIRVRRHPVGPSVQRAQPLALQALAHALVADRLPQRPHNPPAPVAAFVLGVKCGHLGVQRRIALRTRAWRPRSPLAVAGARNVQLTAHPGHAEPVAVRIDPGVLHRDCFAKYAAAFFTISRSSRVLASSRRRRAFSASNSDPDRFTGTAPGFPVASFPTRLSRIQFHKLESGIPSRFAAWQPPIDSARSLGG